MFTPGRKFNSLSTEYTDTENRTTDSNSHKLKACNVAGSWSRPTGTGTVCAHRQTQLRSATSTFPKRTSRTVSPSPSSFTLSALSRRRDAHYSRARSLDVLAVRWSKMKRTQGALMQHSQWLLWVIARFPLTLQLQLLCHRFHDVLVSMATDAICLTHSYNYQVWWNKTYVWTNAQFAKSTF